MNDNTKIGIVSESNARFILVELKDQNVFDQHKESLKIGNYLKVACGNNNFVLVLVEGVKAVNKQDSSGEPNISFVIETQPLGNIDEDNTFSRGSVLLPVPTEPVYVVGNELLVSIFGDSGGYNFEIGVLQQSQEIPLLINGNKFFSKHIAVVGSTGSGKSCAVANIIQKAVGISENKNTNKSAQKNAHIVIFDIHSEYKNAFTLPNDESFNLNYLDFESLALPYWLMNSEELEEMFVESNESNSHNQVSQFRYAVIQNKKKHNPNINVNYDTPVYFSIEEVCNYIENMNEEVVWKGNSDEEAKGFPKLKDDTVIRERLDYYFDNVRSFVTQSTAAATKATSGPFNGEFNRFILRLRTKLQDERLKFLLSSVDRDGNALHSADFSNILKQFIGYVGKSNISIIDLSGIPFEVLSISVSLISRLIFDFSFNYSKVAHGNNKLNDIPIMLVCEEAHNYVPNKASSSYSSSKKSIERIAKEGRKYGLSLMIVSQRPSEVSENIMAQCNNFIALRLTNSNDQNYITKLMPDSSSGLSDVLPKLGEGEFLIVGDSVVIPSIGKMELPKPEPKSQSIRYYDEWSKSWVEAEFESTIARWTGVLETEPDEG